MGVQSASGGSKAKVVKRKFEDEVCTIEKIKNMKQYIVTYSDWAMGHAAVWAVQDNRL